MKRNELHGLSFVFDEAKSQANREKHGIDFVEAQALWLDPNMARFLARTVSEQRYAVVGYIGRKHRTAS